MWTVGAGRYSSTAGAGVTSIDTLDLGASIQSTSYLEIQTTVSTNGIGGVVFDEYASNDFKFVALDIPNQKVLVGHVDPRRGWVIDSSVSRSLTAGADHALQLVLNGASVSVTLGGVLVTSYGFNSAIVDGAVGVLSRGGTASFDSYRILTNDPIFEMASVFVNDA